MKGPDREALPPGASRQRWEYLPIVTAIAASVVILLAPGLRADSPGATATLLVSVAAAFLFASVRSRRWIVVPVGLALFPLCAAITIRTDLQNQTPDPKRIAKAQQMLDEVDRIRREIAECRQFMQTPAPDNPHYLKAPVQQPAMVSKPFQRGATPTTLVVRVPARTATLAQTRWKDHGAAYVAWLQGEELVYLRSADYWRGTPRTALDVFVRATMMAVVGTGALALLNALTLAVLWLTRRRHPKEEETAY
jgi:hypothetical protein